MTSRRTQASIFSQYYYVFCNVLQTLLRKKLGTLLTLSVIAFSLIVPITAYLVWKNTAQMATQVYPQNQLTIYLHKNLSERDARLVADKIKQQTNLTDITYISRQESLEQFRQWSGFTNELDVLEDNPLPAVLLISLDKSAFTLTQINAVKTQLQMIKGVQEVRFNDDNFEKLTALSQLVMQIVIISFILMGLGVFLVIGSSVKAEVYSKKDNIDVMKLLGATDSFILRPFLCQGLIYGFLGAFFSAVLSAVLVVYFSDYIQSVADIFAVSIHIDGLVWQELLFLLIICAAIGYLAARVAATKHINEFERGR